MFSRLNLLHTGLRHKAGSTAAQGLDLRVDRADVETNIFQLAKQNQRANRDGEDECARGDGQGQVRFPVHGQSLRRNRYTNFRFDSATGRFFWLGDPTVPQPLIPAKRVPRSAQGDL